MLSSFMKKALLALALANAISLSEGCTLFCTEEEGFNGSLPIVIEGPLPIPDCQTAKAFEGTLAAFPQFCAPLNGMMSACGCPAPSDNPCNMCGPDGGVVPDNFATTILGQPEDEAESAALSANVDPNFIALFGQAKIGCTMLEEFSKSIDTGTAACSTMTDVFASKCGCGGDGEVTVQTDPPVPEVTPQTDPPVEEVTPQTDPPVEEVTPQTDPPVEDTMAGTMDTPTDAPKDTSGSNVVAGGMMTALVSSGLVYSAFLLI